MKYSLVLSFKTSSGEKSSIIIDNVKPSISENQANTLMDALISKNIFLTSKGAFSEKISASLKENKTTKLNIDLV